MSNNHYENLTPDELVKKLKEKLEKDKNVFSNIVDDSSTNETESITAEMEDLSEVPEIAEIEEADLVDEVEDELEVFDTTPDFVDSNVESVDLVDFEEADDDVIAQLPVDALTYDEDVLSINEPEYNVTVAPAIEDSHNVSDDEYEDAALKEKIALLFADFDELDDDVKAPVLETQAEKTTKDENHPQSVSASDIDSDTKLVDVNTNVRRPKVYRFRKVDLSEQETKLHSVVHFDGADDENEQTRLNDVPELNKPDLKVMQTFGASVEHVRELFGEDVADEYENVLLQSEISERSVVDNEYVSAEQNESVIKKFKSKLAKLKLKMTVSAIMCAILLFLENASLVGITFGGILDSVAYPVSYIMICLQFLLITGALAFSVVKKGIRDIVSLEPSYYSLTLALALVTVVCDIVGCFVEGGIVLYNFCASLALLFALTYEYFMCKRDYMSFKIVSSDKAKSAAMVSIGTAKTPEVAIYEQLEEDEEIKLISLHRGTFINDFFSRSKQTDSSVQDKIILPLTISVMVILFIVSLVLHDDYAHSLMIANMSLSVLVPFAAYFSLAIPFSKATASLYESGSAIVGTSTLDEYAGSSIICFEDKDIFPSYCVKLKSVKVYGDSRIDRILYNTASVFSKAGGPLSDVFSLATMEIGISDSVELVRADDDGIEAIVDSKRILVGKETFLAKYGIFARNDESDDNKYTRMYVAEDDFLSAKFYIKYSLDVDFENVISRIAGCGICGVLKTFDPNIDDDLVSRYIDTNKYPVKVVKCKIGDDISTVREELNSGIVSISNAKSTVDAVVACERLYNIRSSSNTVKILATIIGIILCAFIAFFNVSPISSVLIALYQLLWTIPNIISAALYINR